MKQYRKHFSTIVSTIISVAVAIIAMSCSGASNVAGTEVGNEFIVMTVFLPDGTTPAANTTVEIYSSDDSSHIPVQSTSTDDNGVYQLSEDLTEGVFYNIWTMSDTLVSFQDSVFISEGKCNAINDTLSLSRTISGFVDVQGSSDTGTVTVHLLGSPIKAVVDTNGHYTLPNVASGDYTVLCVSTSEYEFDESKDSESLSLLYQLEISSETSDTLSDTLQFLINDDSINIELLNLTAREHGYSNFETTVIGSELELASLIDEFNGQPHWNEKENILSEVRAWDIDFDSSYVVFYRHTEGSGSVGVSIEEPIWVYSIPSISIERDVPEAGTMDMAYYCFAFKVNRNYSEIMIDGTTITDSSDVIDTLSLLDTVEAVGYLMPVLEGESAYQYATHALDTSRKELPLTTKKALLKHFVFGGDTDSALLKQYEGKIVRIKGVKVSEYGLDKSAFVTDVSVEVVDELVDDTLSNNKALWESANIENYSYGLEIVGSSPDTGTYVITVFDDSLTFAITTPNRPSDLSVASIEDLFSKIDEVEGTASITGSYEFDSALGYPTTASLTWDDSLTYTVSNFQDLTPQFDDSLYSETKTVFITNEPNHYRYTYSNFSGASFQEIEIEVLGNSLIVGSDTLSNDTTTRYSIHTIFAQIEKSANKIGEKVYNSIENVYTYDVSVTYDSIHHFPSDVTPMLHEAGIGPEDMDNSYRISNFRVITDSLISTDSLAYHKSLWESATIDNYSYDLEITGFSPDRGNYLITVINDSVVNAFNNDDFTDSDIDVWKIEDLFTLIEKNKADSDVELSCLYDSLLGYPTSIALSWGESMGYTVSNFKDNTPQFDYVLFQEMRQKFTDNKPEHYQYLHGFSAGNWREETEVEIMADSLYLLDGTEVSKDSAYDVSVESVFSKIEQYYQKIGTKFWDIDEIYIKDVSVRYDTATGVPLSVSPMTIQTSMYIADASEGYGISDFEIITDEIPSDDIDIKFLTLTPREHGYSNFETTVIESEEELRSLINEFNGQTGWNEKDSILNQINSWDIDFNSSYILFYRHTEGSGSIGISIEEPIWVYSIPSISIQRDVPDDGTDDMAYYCFAFKVDRKYSEIMINGNSVTITDTSDVID